MIDYPGRLAVQQRVLPNYRVAFFDLLARRCRGGLVLFSGEPLPGESIPVGDRPREAEHTLGRNAHTFYPGHPFYLCNQPYLLRWLEQTRPDALVVEANPRYPRNLDAVNRVHQRGKPALGWGLGVPEAGGIGSVLRGLLRDRMLKKLDGIIAYSSQGAAEYARTGFFKPGTIFTARNAAAPPPGHPPARPGTHEGRLNVLFVGRLQKRKRLDLLFKACRSLPDHLLPAVTVVGDGPDRTHFEDLARGMQLPVKFTGALHGAALAERFRTADLFVLPGTGGLAVQEAMSYGLPVIVADGDGTQKDLVRPDSGWLVPPGDLSALSGTLEMALADRAGLAARGAESRRIAVEEINIETMADRFIEAVLTVSRIK
jgi:glycosyltransferase involved in cell wall biosynthesis